jgi:Bacterial archaeo-eukaryotic release factor family 10
MLTMSQLESLSQLPPPLLTAYVRTVPVEASLHGATPEYLAWLKDESRPVVESLSPTEQQLFRKQVDRIEEFLRQRQPHERSLVILAGSAVWEIVSLQREVENELHWGKPSVTQLLWLASEYKPHGIVAVDHAGARFFHYRLGEMVEDEEKKFAVDLSQWKKEELGHVTGQGVRKTRGSQREVFRNRMEGQYARLCRETAQRPGDKSDPPFDKPF